MIFKRYKEAIARLEEEITLLKEQLDTALSRKDHWKTAHRELTWKTRKLEDRLEFYKGQVPEPMEGNAGKRMKILVRTLELYTKKFLDEVDYHFDTFGNLFINVDCSEYRLAKKENPRVYKFVYCKRKEIGEELHKVSETYHEESGGQLELIYWRFRRHDEIRRDNGLSKEIGEEIDYLNKKRTAKLLNDEENKSECDE